MSWWKKLFGRPSGDTPVAPPKEGGSVASLVAFQPHNDIERRLIEAATNPDARAGFQRALLNAQLYAATPTAPAVDGVWTASAGDTVQLLNVEGPEGGQVAAVFTAQERIVEVFGMGAGFVAARGEDLLSMLVPQGAWLNPGFPYSVYWTGDQLSALLGRPVPRVMQRATQVMLGVPQSPPTALVEDLKAALAGDERIVEAWFALAHWPEEDTYSWYLDIRTLLSPEDLQRRLADIFKRGPFDGLPLDMVVKTPNQDQPTFGLRLVPTQTH
jgi:hypothetical protein